jgi:hypothetical protein
MYYLVLKVGPHGRAGNQKSAKGAIEVDLAGAEVLGVGHSKKIKRGVRKSDKELGRREWESERELS